MCGCNKAKAATYEVTAKDGTKTTVASQTEARTQARIVNGTWGLKTS